MRYLSLFVLAVAVAACGPRSQTPEPTPPIAPAVSTAAQQAQAAINNKDYATAERLLEDALKANPEDPDAWFLLGFSRHMRGDYASALEAHLRATEFPKTRLLAHYNAGCAYSMLDKVDESIEHLQQAVAAGFSDRGMLQTDADLANVRADPRFAALLPELMRGAEAFVEPTTVIHEILGEGPGNEFGWVARRVGDVDGDGAQDFVATAPGFSNHTGKAYVYSGATGELLFDRLGKPRSRYGNGAGAAGDVNADGVPDILVGAPAGGSGYAEVLSGKDGSVLLTLNGDQSASKFGYKVAGLGDVDGDGHADIAVTQPAAGAGRCFGYSGKDGKPLFEIEGEEEGDQFGSAVASDGKTLVVGAQDAGAADGGRVYVYDLSRRPTRRFIVEPSQDSKDLGQMFLSFPGDLDRDGTPDIFCSDFACEPGGRALVFSGKDGKTILELFGEGGEGLGTSVSDAGDADGDGVGDLIVGAWQNGIGATSGGRAYLVSGATGTRMATWTCRSGGDTFGFDATGLGDVNADGSTDFLITSAWSGVRGGKSGRVFVISGGLVRN